MKEKLLLMHNGNDFELLASQMLFTFTGRSSSIHPLVNGQVILKPAIQHI